MTDSIYGICAPVGEPGALVSSSQMWQVVAPNSLESLLQLFGLFKSSVKERGAVKPQTLVRQPKRWVGFCFCGMDIV